MCLVVFSLNQHPQYPLIVAANRDEFFERPTKALHHWPDHPQILAGRDKVANGSWLGISKNGRFSAVTNIRKFPMATKSLSRGDLISTFLTSEQSPQTFNQTLASTASHYSGFNLFVGRLKSAEAIELLYSNNQHFAPEVVTAGVHGISNGLLSDNWRKVTHTQKRFLDAIQKPFKREDLLQVLRHNEALPDEQLPQTGIPKLFEQQLSSAFIPTFEINGKAYGTRSQALITVNQDLKCTYYEIQLDAKQQITSEQQFVMQLQP